MMTTELFPWPVRRGTTTVDLVWALAGTDPLPLPLGATVVSADGLLALSGGLQPAPGATTATYSYTVPGVSPQGVESLNPGDALSISGPGIRWVATVEGDVKLGGVGELLRAEAGPLGGVLRYRVESVQGEPVIPDATVFVAGNAVFKSDDYRAAIASLR